MATARAGKSTSPFRKNDQKEIIKAQDSQVHIYGHKVKCATDTRGYPVPDNQDRTRIVVDASEGFIPLWAKRSTLRWRFQAQSISTFSHPEAAKAAVRNLLGKALLAWGDAVPIKFSERKDAWDFEIAIRNADDCDARGCTLAMSFFPDAGRHELLIYPKMFEQAEKEQIDTLVHELGHVFGLRHFFAKLSENRWPSEIFGVHRPFSIMNYGADSELTDDDKGDLKRLYQSVWSGQLTEINATPIKLVRPFHYG